MPFVRLPQPRLLALAVFGAVGLSALALAAVAPEKPALEALPGSKVLKRSAKPAAALKLDDGKIQLTNTWERRYKWAAGEAHEITVHLDKPSALPPNGRVGVEWTLEQPANPADVVATPQEGPRKVNDHGIYTAPTANWRKVLHALDSDVYTIYRAPVAGTYRLRLVPITDETPIGDTPRWREKGGAPDMFPLPKETPWPAGTIAPVRVAVKKVDLGNEAQTQALGQMIEAEPNDTPEQAQHLALVPSNDIRSYEITGTSDDIEFFDNGKVGASGDDWFRVELKGTEPRLVTAQLGMPNQFLAARIRCYQLGDGASPNVKLGALVPINEHFGKVNKNRLPWQEGKQIEFAEGMDPNERSHQQEEQHRTNINRILEPGKTYYFRVEANAPSYQLTIRVLKPSPHADPRMAVRQAMYLHVGQVDAWLTNRPRGASVDRRIRDTGNLLGTQCMSCHTQSGLWGPVVPALNGYKIENVQNYRHLINVMYECLRPTNVLKDAANNTSLAPLDIGDGPAGTRAAGFNIVNVEQLEKPRKLHGSQQVRTANFVAQTADPSGINAAGPGSNVGQNIVWLFAGEILNTSWKKTGDPKYFRLLQDKARKVLALQPKYTDDIAVRMDFFGRVFPMKAYAAELEKAADAEKAAGKTPPTEDPAAFVKQVGEQLKADEARLLAIQGDDGLWGFNPGTTTDDGKTWKRTEGDWDPSPTALAITGLNAIGYTKDHPVIAKGVQALLRIQDPDGRWNRATITGFVPTAYVLRTLGRLYPVKPHVPTRAEFTAQPNESTLATIKRVQALALLGDPKFEDLLLKETKSSNTLVRYWAYLGLGQTHTDKAIPALMAGIKEDAKPVRDVAMYSLRMTLTDDRGWNQVYAALESGDDDTRSSVMQALGMRADTVMPGSTVDHARLAKLLDRGMNDDPHPAVRAHASKAAWQWWVWNPPVREAINAAWIRMVERPEPNALVENNNRYSSQALFIANGHKANGSTEHQYKELATLFEAMRKRLETADPATKSRMARRLVATGATFYQTAGGDGGPGQMGYTTPGAGALFGQAAVVYLREVEPTKQVAPIRWGLEGASNVPHGPLQEFLINYALNAPEDLRREAAAAVSDPRSAMLQAATELVEPLIAQVKRGANEPARRATLSDPVLKLFGSVNWVIPKDQEQQRHFFDLIVPKLERYISQAEIDALPDGEKAAAQREMDAAWYLADKLGDVIASNPDLHHEMVFQKYFPEKISNPLEQHLWVRSVPWMLEHKHALPEITLAQPVMPGGKKPAEVKLDPGLIIKDRALQVYLDALSKDAPARTRAAAVRISNATAVRRNPEVLLALNNLLTYEKDEKLREIAQNVIKQGSDRFIPDLVAALKAENKPGNWLTSEGKVNPTLLQDVTYYRDYVLPELARVKRNDQASCLGCHGVPGRVPSFILKPVDQYGYLSVPDLLHNYRETQSKVNLKDIDRSKLLRKPLNVQDGTEDGHQGGRRYLPQDEGWLILKRWAENQPKVLESAMAAAINGLKRLFAQAR